MVTSRLVTSLCAAVLAVLSLTPAQHLPRTSLGGHTEHLLMYAAAAFAIGLAYGEARALRAFALLILYAGALEWLQRFSPGRTSSFADFAFSAAGVAICAVAFELLRAVGRR